MANRANKKSHLTLLAPEASCLLFIDFDETQPGIMPEAPVVGTTHQIVLGKAADLSILSFLSFMINEDHKHSSSPFGSAHTERIALAAISHQSIEG